VHSLPKYPGGGSFEPPTRRRPIAVQILCWVLAAVVGVVCGYAFVTAPGWAGPQVPVWTVAGVAVGLAVVCVMGHVGIHAWWGLPVVWVGFMVGAVPPLSTEDALWAVAAFMLGALVAGYLTLINVVILGVRGLARRRSQVGR
jgi:hypothetical protein